MGTEYSITNILSQSKQLKDDGLFKEALQLINQLENEVDLTLEEQFEYNHLKSSLLFEQGYLEEALKYTELALKDSQQLKNNILTIDVLFVKTEILKFSGRYKEALDISFEAEQILNSLDNISPILFKEKMGYILFEKSTINVHGGDLNLSLRFAEDFFQLANEINDKKLIGLYNKVMGVINGTRGDNNTALKYTQQALKLAKEINDKQTVIAALNNIGSSLCEMGDFDQALKYLRQSLDLCEQTGSFKISSVLNSLYYLYLEMNSFKKAQECLEHIIEFVDQRGEKVGCTYADYKLINALIQKKSSNVGDRIRAREYFKEEIEKKEILCQKLYTSLFNLCDLLLEELRSTNDIKILDEVQPYLNRMFDLAKREKSFWLLAEAYLLQAKLKLITFEFEEAQRLITQGLHIAEKYDLNLLVKKIKKEQEELSKNSNKWEKLKKSKAHMSSRMALAGVDEQIKRMLKKRFQLTKMV